MALSSGYLTVRASTASQAVPVSNAMVTVFSSTDKELPLDSSPTDSSGQSKVFTLPAPPQTYSTQPNEPTPYLNYLVRVSHPSYASVEVDSVSIFPGISSTLPVYLTPGPSSDPITFIVTTGPRGSGGANG